MTNGARSSGEPHGEIALMLCESLLHVLFEEGVITREKAIDAIETVAELAREMAEHAETLRATQPRAPRQGARARVAVKLIESIRRSFVAKTRS